MNSLTQSLLLKILTLKILIFIFVYPSVVQSQPTLIDGDNVTYGGYGGPTISVTNLGDETAVLMGGSGAWITKLESGNSISFGMAGYGLASNLKVDEISGNENEYLFFGYGGFQTEFTYQSNNIFHTTFKTLIGSGITGNRSKYHDFDENHDGMFFALEPSVNVEANVTKHFRIETGISYRFISGSNNSDFSDKDLSGLNGLISLKFGWF